MIFTNYATGWLSYQLSKSRKQQQDLVTDYGYFEVLTPHVEEWVTEEKLLLQERIDWLSMVLSWPPWTHYAAALFLKAAQAIDPPAP